MTIDKVALPVEKTFIKIRGARVHNLKNIDIDIPLQQIVCLMGPSGSGKTSLALHTLLAESRRRFLNALPNTLKLFQQRPTPVDVDFLAPVLPIFGLLQHNPVMNSRSTVADTMGVTDLLQNIFAQCAQEYCDQHQIMLEYLAPDVQVKKKVPFDIAPEDTVHLFMEKELYQLRLGRQLMPSRSWNSTLGVVEEFNEESEYWELGRFKGRSLGEIKKYLFQDQRCIFEQFYLWIPEKCKTGFVKIVLDTKKQCSICFKLESIVQGADQAFSPLNSLGACEQCSGFGGILQYDERKLFDKEKSVAENGIRIFKTPSFATILHEFKNTCKKLGYDLAISLAEQPPVFWTMLYQGHGKFKGLNYIFDYLEKKQYKPAVKSLIRSMQSEVTCRSCNGSRLRSETRNFLIFLGDKKYSLQDLVSLDLAGMQKLWHQKNLFASTNDHHHLNNVKQQIIQLKELVDVAVSLGLGHLHLLRKTKHISGGEYQRLLFLKFFSFQGTDSVFVFDEPSVGLSPDLWPALWQGLEKLKEQGNTVLLIEHSDYFHQKVDHLIHIGPGSGEFGGQIVNQGSWKELEKNRVAKKSNAQLLADLKTWHHQFKRSQESKDFLVLLNFTGPSIYQKNYDDITLYQGAMHVVLGESGSGKSSVLMKMLANRLNYELSGDYLWGPLSGTYKKLTIKSNVAKIIVTEANFRRFTSRSSVGSFTELVMPVRKYFAQLSEAKERGYTEAYFSTNSELGQCPECQGKGILEVELQYLEDIVITCEACEGVGLKKEIAELDDGHIRVRDALQMPMEKILGRIPLTAKFQRIFQSVQELKLSHLSLERQMSTLSGGEKQRINLLAHIIQKPVDALIFIENISFGLSMDELIPLAKFIAKIQQDGNTIVMIDYHPVWQQIAHFVLHFSANGKVQKISNYEHTKQ